MNKLEESFGYEEEQRIIRGFFMGDHIQFNDKRGHLWVCKHASIFETLTWEPPEGGQYEIAVRILIHPPDETYWKYPGYVANDGYLVGKGTGGH